MDIRAGLSVVLGTTDLDPYRIFLVIGLYGGFIFRDVMAQEIINACILGLFNLFWCWFLCYQPSQYGEEDE